MKVEHTRLLDLVFDLIDLVAEKSKEYSSEPILSEELHIDDIISVIKLKALRARESITIEKLREEVSDLVCYGLLLLYRLERES